MPVTLNQPELSRTISQPIMPQRDVTCRSQSPKSSQLPPPQKHAHETHSSASPVLRSALDVRCFPFFDAVTRLNRHKPNQPAQLPAKLWAVCPLRRPGFGLWPVRRIPLRTERGVYAAKTRACPGPASFAGTSRKSEISNVKSPIQWRPLSPAHEPPP